MMTDNLNAPQSAVQPRAGLGKRLFAFMMSSSASEYDTMVADRKRTLLGALHGEVLEIGPGTGPNLAYYAADVHWIGVEPNPAMHPYLQREAKRLGLMLELRRSEADRLPAADNSLDAVVSTLVLCSVRNPTHMLQEIVRVLKPGGQFVFIEHVAAPRETGLRRRQRFVRPVWQIVSDGCQPDRETWTIIENAGFSQVQLTHFRVDAPLVGPHIAGFAIK